MLEESTQSSIDALSILEADLTNQETTFPLLEAGVVDFVISDAKLEPTKTGSGYMLNLRLKTTMPWKTNLGVDKAPGFPMRAGIFIPGGANVNPEAVNMSKTKLAQLKESAFGDKTGSFGKPEQYIGRTITARIAIVKDSRDANNLQNEVQAYVKRTA